MTISTKPVPGERPADEADLKDLLFDHFARIGRALSSPHRLVLLDLLDQGEKTVETLAARARYPLKNTSAHLRALRQARLVETRKEGTYVYYRLASEPVSKFLHQLLNLGEQQLAEVDQLVRIHFERPDGPAPIEGAEVLGRIGKTVTIIDLRPPDEYRAGHLPGAISIPGAELSGRLAEVPKSREVVVHCRGPYCTHGTDAVMILRRAGYKARRLRDGFSGWRAGDLPIEVSAG